MQTFTDYKIIEHHNLEELQRLVNHYLNNGWEPLGGIAMSSPTSERQQIQFAQAVVFKSKRNGI
ncbi:MAG: DUF1737 domain-containing protein [Bacteroidota bacterium]|nr:DUF1737 domain-containing protein [Flavisolibacter sp.]MDQ3843657.1 DUF1737 domain-containing protein [Bacteroidota bacterium]MBD0285106.1 DUF1737 domain-containing protein [Flavisolibacter sp.]MBD0294479.1 DUF1737 domain-containing protein [Flavisolibacter sp.]MBD0352179.1 DUF1737 domain-containing protein [Flavisolibacter sp.]